MSRARQRDIRLGAGRTVLKQLEDSRVDESTLRSADMQVPLPAELIRQIPFTLSEKGEKFSMERLSATGSTVDGGRGFKTTGLRSVKKAYRLRSDKALEQAIDGKMQIPTIERVEVAADDMFRRLDDVVGPSPDRLYMEAKERLNELKATVRLLKTEMVGRAIGDIGKYSGMTVNELRGFHADLHHLRLPPRSA